MYEGKFCIVRSTDQDVFFAKVESMEGQIAQLREARRLWYWEGAATTAQLAMEGVKRPDACKFTMVVPEMTLTQIIEVIPCTDAAVKNLSEVPIWKQ